MSFVDLQSFVAKGQAAQAAVDAQLDLFVSSAMRAEMTKRQLKDLPKGYRGTPGRGPAGESCGSCAHCQGTWSGSGKRFNKCDLVKPTSGPGTDIRRKSPACQFWAAIVKGEQ